MRRLAPALVFALLITAACSRAPETAPSAAAPYGPDAPAGMGISDARVQLPAVPGRPAVAYFTLNPGAKASGELAAVHVDHFARAEMHESRMEGGMMTMAPVTRVPLTPGKPITFAPGGFHVMLFDGDGKLAAGQTTELTATLANGDKISAIAKVIATGGAMSGM